MRNTNKALMLFIVLAGVFFACGAVKAATGGCFCDLFDTTKKADDPTQIEIHGMTGLTEEECVTNPMGYEPTLSNCKWEFYTGNEKGCCNYMRTSDKTDGKEEYFTPMNSDVFCQQMCADFEIKYFESSFSCKYDENTTQEDCKKKSTIYFGCCEYKEETTENIFLKYAYQPSKSDCEDMCANASSLVSECKFLPDETQDVCASKKQIDMKPGATTLPSGELMGPPTPSAEETTPPAATPSAFDIPDASVLNQLTLTGDAQKDVRTVIGTLIKTGMTLMGSIALALFVYGGVLWMASAGNAERSKKGLQVIVWAAIGMFVIMASYVIVNFVFEAFK